MRPLLISLIVPAAVALLALGGCSTTAETGEGPTASKPAKVVTPTPTPTPTPTFMASNVIREIDANGYEVDVTVTKWAQTASAPACGSTPGNVTRTYDLDLLIMFPAVNGIRFTGKGAFWNLQPGTGSGFDTSVCDLGNNAGTATNPVFNVSGTPIQARYQIVYSSKKTPNAPDGSIPSTFQEIYLSMMNVSAQDCAAASGDGFTANYGIGAFGGHYCVIYPTALYG